MKRLLLLSIASFCWVTSIARADQGATAQLIEQLQGITHMQGAFVQRQYASDSSAVIATSSGDFKLLRPGYFSWALGAPDQQLIIADLEVLWHYDIDLETVTRRPVSSGTQISPLQILSGNAQVLRDNFDVSLDNQQRYLLQARKEGAGFNSLLITLEQGVVTRMDILDKLNQRIEIEFLEVDSTSHLSPEDFDFIPPAGVDLFTYDE